MSNNKVVGYLCGVLCAGGMVIQSRSTGNYSLRFETRDMGLARNLVLCLKHTFKLKPKVYSVIRQGPGRARRAKVIIFSNKKLVQGFKRRWKFRLGRKWTIPLQAYELKIFRRAFLKGFFDKKGSYSVKKKRGTLPVLRVSSMHRAGLNELRNLLKLEGISSSVYSAGPCFTLELAGKRRANLFKKRISDWWFSFHPLSSFKKK